MVKNGWLTDGKSLTTAINDLRMCADQRCATCKIKYASCIRHEIMTCAADLLEYTREEIEGENNENGSTVDHPAHYNRAGSMECIEEMVQVFGFKQTMDFCLLNVWKYRYRAAEKGGAQDMEKSDWYMRKYVELDKRLGRGDLYGDAE